MIRRGTRRSRLLALLVAAAPLIFLIGLFSHWAYGRWSDGGEALREAALRKHEAAARTSQARQYAPLGEVWREFADSPTSGLDHAEDAEAALTTLRGRLDTLFLEAGGTLRAVQRLEDGADAPPGLQHLRVEATAETPERTLRAALAALETQTPYVFVEMLDVKRAVESDALDLRLRLSLYRMAEEGS